MQTNQNTMIGINPTTGMSELQVILPVGEAENLLQDHKSVIDLLTKFSDDLSDNERYLLERLLQATTPSSALMHPPSFTKKNTTEDTTSQNKWPVIEIEIQDQEDYDMILSATIELMDEILPESQKPNARAIDQWKSMLLMWILRDLNPSEMQKAP